MMPQQEEKIASPIVGFDNQWLPFTPNRDFKADPKMFSRAKGDRYWDEKGNELIDGSSGLFTCPGGHGREQIADAVRDQLMTLDFAPSFTRAHESSFELAQVISDLLPKD